MKFNLGNFLTFGDTFYCNKIQHTIQLHILSVTLQYRPNVSVATEQLQLQNTVMSCSL